MASFIASLGAGFSGIVGTIADRVEGIVSTIINFFRNFANNVYIFFMKMWDVMTHNPMKFIRFLANVYVLML